MENSSDLAAEISEAQDVLKTFVCVMEIYWIKGHSGIQGNELEDQAAKRADSIASNQLKHQNFSKSSIIN